MLPAKDVVDETVRALVQAPVAGSVAGAVSATVPTEADEPVIVPAPGRSFRDWFKTENFDHINELVAGASRLATSVRGGLRAIWVTIATILGIGGATLGGNSVGLVDPNKGVPQVATKALAPFPVLMVVVITVMVTTLLIGGLAILYLRRVKKGVISAKKAGRYTPPAPVPQEA